MANIINSYFHTTGEQNEADADRQGANLMIGQVEKVHYVDDETNLSKKFIEYDVSVYDNYGGQSLYNNVRKLESLGSTHDYSDTVLQNTDFVEGGTVDDVNFFEKKSGTLVVVGFLHGSIEKPIIIGTLTHQALSEENIPTKEKGIHSKREFRGFTTEINKDGELLVTYNGAKNPDGTPADETQSPVTFKIGKEPTVETETGHKVIFANTEGNEQVIIQGKSGQAIIMGEAEGNESISMISKASALVNMTPDGSLILSNKAGAATFNTDDTSITLSQIDGNMVGITTEGVQIAHKDGEDLITVEKGKVQLTTGGSLSYSTSGFGIDTGSFAVKDNVGDEFAMANNEIYALNALGAGWKVNAAGQVALGGPTAEVLDLIDQTLTQLDALLTALSTETHTGNLGYPTSPPINAAAYAAVQAQLALIKGLLATIKGSL